MAISRGPWRGFYSAYPLKVTLHRAHVVSTSHPGAVLRRCKLVLTQPVWEIFLSYYFI